jgi:hypothetical protein
MIEFTLSKLNLLIFVLSIAAIVIFFMNTVNSNLQTRQSYELAYKVGQEVESILNSESYCSSRYVNIPNTIQLNSGEHSRNNLNYILRIYDFPSDNLDDKNKLVFTIMDKRNNEIYAAYDIDYNGVVNFYNYNLTASNYIYNPTTDGYLDLNPTKKDSIDNKIIIAKKIKAGRQHIYVFACDDYVDKPACVNHLDENLIPNENLSCLCIIPEIQVNVNNTCN